MCIRDRVYDDAVCYAFYPIDLHQPLGIKQIFLEEGVIPTIPYGALIPRGAKRCLLYTSDNDDARSLNLSNAVAVGVYEALRQWGFPGLRTQGHLTKYDGFTE